jgi:hypothetical protein
MNGDQGVQCQNTVTFIYPTDAVVPQQFEIAISRYAELSLHVKLQARGVNLTHFRENAAIEHGQDGILYQMFEITAVGTVGIVNRRGATY